jgi:hypothetical protein
MNDLFTLCHFSVNSDSGKYPPVDIDKEPTPLLPYNEEKNIFLACVQLLTFYWDPEKINHPTFVYVGYWSRALPLLALLYPGVTFYVYLSDISMHSPKKDLRIPENMTLSLEPIQESDLDRFHSIKENVFLFSSVSYIKISKKTKYVRKNINADFLKEQANIFSSIDPEHAYLTFYIPPRFDYDDDDASIPYYDGYLYWSIWGNPLSYLNATWLKPVKNNKGKYTVGEWSVDEYLEWLDHHNYVERFNEYRNPYTGNYDAIDYPELLNYFDDVAQTKLLEKYVESTTSDTLSNENKFLLVKKITKTMEMALKKEPGEMDLSYKRNVPTDPFRTKIVEKVAIVEKVEPALSVDSIQLSVTDEQVEKYKKMKEAVNRIKK